MAEIIDIQQFDLKRRLELLSYKPKLSEYLSILLDEESRGRTRNIEQIIEWWRGHRELFTYENVRLELSEFLGSNKLIFSNECNKDPVIEDAVVGEGPIEGQQNGVERIAEENISGKEICERLKKDIDTTHELESEYPQYRYFISALYDLYGCAECSNPDDPEQESIGVYFNLFGSDDPASIVSETMREYYAGDESRDRVKGITSDSGRERQLALTEEGILHNHLKELADFISSGDVSYSITYRFLLDDKKTKCIEDVRTDDDLRLHVIAHACMTDDAALGGIIKYIDMSYEDLLQMMMRLRLCPARSNASPPRFPLEAIVEYSHDSDLIGVSNISSLQWKKFFSDFRKYRASFSGGRSPFEDPIFSDIYSYELYKLVSNQLGPDVDFDDGVYMFNEYGMDLTILYSPISHLSTHYRITGPYGEDVIDLYKGNVMALQEEGNYKASNALLSFIMFILCQKEKGNLESVEGLYQLIDSGMKSMGLDAGVGMLKKAITHCMNVARDNGHMITYNKLLQYDIDESERLQSMVSQGENRRLEFKSTLSLNLKTGKHDKAIEFSVLKAIASFLNTDGGTLLVGVDDDGGIIGVDSDRRNDLDAFLLHFDNICRRLVGPYHSFVRPSVERLEGVPVLAVLCERSSTPVFVKHPKNGREEFYIRKGASSEALSLSDVYGYFKNRFYH